MCLNKNHTCSFWNYISSELQGKRKGVTYINKMKKVEKYGSSFSCYSNRYKDCEVQRRPYQILDMQRVNHAKFVLLLVETKLRISVYAICISVLFLCILFYLA